MAKRSSSRGSEEKSNTGLIVTLVFFILTTIGLGVSTYYGYAGKADALKDTKTANDKAAASDKKADEADTRRAAVKAAVGVADASDKAKLGGGRSTYGSQITGDVTPIYTEL